MTPPLSGQGRKIAPEKRIYATLAVSGEALINTEALLRFLNQLSVLETPPDGFYVLVAAGNAETRAHLFNAEVIAGWMFLNHVLSVNGFLVINGFSDLLTPFLGAAGAEAEPPAGGRTSDVLFERFNQGPVGAEADGTPAAPCSIGSRITNWISCGAGCAVPPTWYRRPMGGAPSRRAIRKFCKLGMPSSAEPSACERRRKSLYSGAARQ